MQNEENNVQAIMQPLVNGSLWMKLAAVLMIIAGALQALTIIGILWAWVPIWMGVLLFQAAGAADQAARSGEAGHAVLASDKLRLFFMIQCIVMLVGLVVGLIGFMIGGMAVFTGLAGMTS